MGRIEPNINTNNTTSTTIETENDKDVKDSNEIDTVDGKEQDSLNRYFISNQVTLTFGIASLFLSLL